MFIDIRREKLLNACVFFVQNTKNCHTLKLFKLLNFLDFEHYRSTGRTVTGLRYKAFDKGPVPDTLWEEIKDPPPDLSQKLAILPVHDDLTGELVKRKIKAKSQFEQKYFSKVEMKIMERLAFFFKEAKADDMSEFSHIRNLPWAKVYDKGNGRQRYIPYDMALDSQPIVSDLQSIDVEEADYLKSVLKEARHNVGRRLIH